jgi:hypothetical protein
LTLFIIHRFNNKKKARLLFNKINKINTIKVNAIFLDSPKSKTWKDKALNVISIAEAVVIYDRKSCEESNNAKWEIEVAEESKLPIVEIRTDETVNEVINKLKPIYDLTEEFNKCFECKENDKLIDLYKIMIDSSESLISRRQKTSAFFVTAIGALLSIAGLMLKVGLLTYQTVWLFYGFSIVAFLLCKSWKNLLENYGKLNKAKFDVILRLERELPARIFQAEWISLGKGLRPNKYRSFTSTEQNVPDSFKYLVVCLTILLFIWHVVSLNKYSSLFQKLLLYFTK